jgi:hypothetical protein
MAAWYPSTAFKDRDAESARDPVMFRAGTTTRCLMRQSAPSRGDIAAGAPFELDYPGTRTASFAGHERATDDLASKEVR